ncbi:sensor histidine kinase [Nocardia sp. NPDC003183]
MCSSRRFDAGSAHSWRSTSSLRTRLLAGQLLLMAVVCLCVGAATVFALHQFMMDKLNAEVSEFGQRAADLNGLVNSKLEHPVSSPTSPPRSMGVTGPGPAFLGAPGQPIGAIGAVVDDGMLVSGGVLTSGEARGELSPEASAEVSSLAVDQAPVTRVIDGQGRYLMVARTDSAGHSVVLGVPMKEITETVFRVLVIFLVVTGIALSAAATAGIVIIHRALAPLDRVASTAARVADLQLDRGEVALPVRVAARDTDPRTEVGQLGAAVNLMLTHIAGALSARHASETRVRQFLADASHELRTPLTAIRGYTELAQRNWSQVPNNVANAMSRVSSEAERMTGLVEDMLLLARLDSGRPLVREDVDLSVLTVNAVSDAHIAGPEHRWDLNLPEVPLMITGDADRLQQVLTNLLANARIHTLPGTSITVTLESDDRDGALWRVIDDGPGIPDALQDEVFERFARGDSSRSRRSGSSGLGLAIVAAVVRAHDGTIVLRSVPGATEFIVHLPKGEQRPLPM